MASDGESEVGIGGWLAFFALVMAVITPATMIVMTASALYGDSSVAAAYGDQWSTIQAFEWGLAAVVTAGCWYIVWRLNYVQIWQTVRITIVGLWVIAVGSTAADFLGISLITGIPLGDMTVGVGSEIIRPLAFSALWTTYFLRSKRVANTYRRDTEEVAEVFG